MDREDHLQLLLLVEEQAIVLQKDLPFKTSLWRSFAPELQKLRCVIVGTTIYSGLVDPTVLNLIIFCTLVWMV